MGEGEEWEKKDKEQAGMLFRPLLLLMVVLAV